jgi:hypothetical protein
MEFLELPPRPMGDSAAQITQLWEALFRLTEQLNAQRSAAGRRS